MGSHIRFNLLKGIKIPVEIFQLKKLSVSENLVYYLTAKLDLKQNEIAFLLKRNPRTVWTILTRAQEKMRHLKKIEKQPFEYLQRKIETRQQVRSML